VECSISTGGDSGSGTPRQALNSTAFKLDELAKATLDRNLVRKKKM
jgi:hypothetical protein